MATKISCKHINTFFDEMTNDFVCRQCGLVRTDYAHSDNTIEPIKWSVADKVYPTDLSQFGAKLLKREYQWDIDLLERVCSNFHIATCVEQCVIELLQSNNYIKRRGMRRRNIILLAHAFFEACIKHGCPKSRETVASYFQIEPKLLWNVANEFEYIERKLMPSDLLPPLKVEICSLVETLSHKDFIKIEQTADRICKQSCYSPSVILATCIVLFLKNYPSANAVTMKSIAKICQVSCTSVSNLRNKLQHDVNLFNN